MTFKSDSVSAETAPLRAKSSPPSRPTVRDVALRAGVSVGTVSRVANGAASVNAAVRERVQQAIAALGWSPSVVAQNMRGRATRMIGFIFPDLENPLFSSMIKGAEDVLTKEGYMLVVGSSDGQPEREAALIDLFGQRQADGLIFTIEREREAAVLSRLADARFPAILLERDAGVEGAGAVGADHLGGTYQATRYLIELGHRRIALLAGGRGNRVGRDRWKGFEQAHRDAGLAIDTDLVRLHEATAEHEFGMRQTQLLMALPEPPTALMALGRHLLRAVLATCRMGRIRIPQDLSLITANDSDLAQLATPAVTVIRYSSYDLGREAAELLLHRLRGDQSAGASRIEVPTELVLRESCTPPARARARPGFSAAASDPPALP